MFHESMLCEHSKNVIQFLMVVHTFNSAINFLDGDCIAHLMAVLNVLTCSCLPLQSSPNFSGVAKMLAGPLFANGT